MSNMGFNGSGVFGSILDTIKGFNIIDYLWRKAHIKTQTPGSTVNVRTSPNGEVCAAVKDGAAVTVISSLKGSDGYLWYKISSPPGYVRGDFISFDKTPASVASTLTISNVKTIPNITQGTAVSIYGTISSNYDITSVTVGIYSNEGIVYTEAKASPSVKSYNISSLDALVKFGNAKAGTNFFRVVATDASGTKKTLVNQQFTVSLVTTYNSMKLSDAGAKLLAEMEVPVKDNLIKRDSNGNVNAIKNHDVGDGGITVGYGTYVKYGNAEKQRELKDKYGIDATTLDEWVPIDVCIRLFKESLASYEDTVNTWAKTNNVTLKQNQFDALTLQAYNGWYIKIADAFTSGKPEEEMVQAILDVYRTFQDWETYKNGWENRIRCEVKVFLYGDYKKNY